MSLRRRVVRERVLQALYAYELSQEPIEMIIKNIAGDLQKQPESYAFAKQLILKVIECNKELDRPHTPASGTLGIQSPCHYRQDRFDE